MGRKDRQPFTAAVSSSSGEDSDDTSSSSVDEKSTQPHHKPHVSDSDSDHNPTPSNTNLTPSDPNPNSKIAPLPTIHVIALVAGTSKKKTTDPTNEGPSKKAANEASGSKQLIQRIWSEDDEVAILKGMVEFEQTYGKDPLSDVYGFVGFVTSSLHVPDVKKEQIVNKIRTLKRRFLNGKKRTSTNPDILELSKKIWGGSNDANGVILKGSSSKSKSKGSSSKLKDVKNGVNGVALIDDGGDGDERIKVDESVGVSCRIPLGDLSKFGCLNEKFMNEGFKLLSEDDRVELEEQWLALNVEQMKGLVKQYELYERTAKSILNVAVKSAKC